MRNSTVFNIDCTDPQQSINQTPAAPQYTNTRDVIVTD